MTRADNPPEWQIPCPWCEAPPDVRCTTPRGRRLPNGLQTHDARIHAWNTQQTKEPQ
jgi:hypothetical protein